MPCCRDPAFIAPKCRERTAVVAAIRYAFPLLLSIMTSENRKKEPIAWRAWLTTSMILSLYSSISTCLFFAIAFFLVLTVSKPFFLYNCSWLVMWACRIIHKLLHIIHMHIFSVIHNRVFLILKERKQKKKKRYWIYLRACVWNCRLTLLVFIASVAEQKIHSFHSHPVILFFGGVCLVVGASCDATQHQLPSSVTRWLDNHFVRKKNFNRRMQ